MKKPVNNTVEVHIDISPGKDKTCCQNCKSFSKFGVHLGYCSEKNTEKMDNQACKKFELEIEEREDL